MRTLIQYFKDCVHELNMTTWPKQDELINHTTITIIFVLISAILLGMVDFSFSKLFQWFLSLS